MLAGAGSLGVLTILAACASTGSGDGGPPGLGGDGGTGGTGGAQPAGVTPGPTRTGPVDLGKSTEIPVGGGIIFNDESVVVTQPTKGVFKAFSSTCTHQGCTVASVAGGLIMCPCHGSEYSIVDGSVKVGPAPRPLPAKTATVQGDTIVVS